MTSLTSLSTFVCRTTAASSRPRIEGKGMIGVVLSGYRTPIDYAEGSHNQQYTNNVLEMKGVQISQTDGSHST